MFCLMLMKSTNEWESRGPRGEEACMLALDLWDVVIEVLHSSKNTHQAVGNHCRKEEVDDQMPRSRARGEIRCTNTNTK